MNTLYLTYDGLTDPLGQSQILPYIIGLSRKGHSFTIVSFEKKDRFHLNKNRIEEICQSENIQWHPLSYTKNPPVLATVFDVWKLNKITARLHKSHSYDIVHCRSYITALTGLKLSRKFNVKFIFDMRGFWADERVDGELWNLKNPVYQKVYSFFKKKEREFLSESDAVISLTNAAKQDLLQWKKVEIKPEKITVIPCAADFELFQLKTNQNQAQAKELLDIGKNQFVLSYLGSLGTWYMLEEMIQFFALLKSKIPQSVFLFLTPDRPETILSMGEKYGLEPSNFKIKFANRKEIPSFIHASDYNIFFIQPKYSKISSSPTKMGEVMAMGIPIICNSKIGDVEEIVQSINGGFCISDFTKTEYQKVIVEINKALEFNPEEIRNKARDHFDLATRIESYNEIYERI